MLWSKQGFKGVEERQKSGLEPSVVLLVSRSIINTLLFFMASSSDYSTGPLKIKLYAHHLIGKDEFIGEVEEDAEKFAARADAAGEHDIPLLC